MQVKGKVCVVTGGASGIGEAVARAYAEAGAKGVVVADLKTSRERLANVAGDIDGLAVTADVGLEEDVKALIAAAEGKYGPVDVFFSNAGLSRKGQETASDADWDVSWRVHVMSHVFAARALVPVCWRAAPAICSTPPPPRPPGVAESDALWRDKMPRWRLRNISPFNMATAASASPCCARSRCRPA
jgi:NAD(P)-dependent dehydrogenase (short-subunit alcohol dehydrogenase family)